MKRLILLLFSLVSFLFGCSEKKVPPTKPAVWPRFPDADNPAVKIAAVLPDSMSLIQAFFIPADKMQVYVVTCQNLPANGPDKYFNVPRMVDFHLLCLDEKGKILRKIKLPKSDQRYGASMGILEHRLAIRLSDVFLVLDPEKLDIMEKIPIWFGERFPSKQKVELMTPDEQRPAYAEAFDAAVKNAKDSNFLDWVPRGDGYVLIRDVNGHRAAWSPQRFVDNHFSELQQLYPNITVMLNPGYQYDASKGLLQIADDHTGIQEVEILPDGTQQYWHTQKVRRIIQSEMTLGGKKLRFSTGDRDGHDLRLVFSDNKMLSTQGGTGWLQYEGLLYRIE